LGNGGKARLIASREDTGQVGGGETRSAETVPRSGFGHREKKKRRGLVSLLKGGVGGGVGHPGSLKGILLGKGNTKPGWPPKAASVRDERERKNLMRKTFWAGGASLKGSESFCWEILHPDLRGCVL